MFSETMANGTRCRTVPMQMKIGREEFYTDVPFVDRDNVIEIMQDAFNRNLARAREINRLLNFEAGCQPLKRTKTFRPDIDVECVDNVAAEVTDFKLGYFWGNPVTFVQRGDGGSETEAISLLNRQYEATGSRTKTQRNARFIEISGIGYTYIDINTEHSEGDSYFIREILDPRTTFVIRSSYYPDGRPMLGVTFRMDKGGNCFITAFSHEQRFEIASLKSASPGVSGIRDRRGNVWAHAERSGEENPLHLIPIIEWFRSYDRMGCFEKQIPEMDNLNILVSDFTNDVDQNTQAVWWTNDVELEKSVTVNGDGSQTIENRNPQKGEWMHTFTPKDGKTPIVQPLAIGYDYSGMLDNILARRALILQKCKVPQRNDNSGGSTGIAMSDATGWSAAEVDACMEQQIIEGCVAEELKAVLAAIRESPDIRPDNPLLGLKYSDIQVNFKRNKTIELTSKANAVSTLLSHGFALEDVLANIPLFDDPGQTIQRSGEGVRRYQETIWSQGNEAEGGTGEAAPNADRISQDESDQRTQSPMLSGVA